MAWYDADPIIEPTQAKGGNFWEADEIVQPREQKGFYGSTYDALKQRGARLADSVAGEDTVFETAYQFPLQQEILQAMRPEVMNRVDAAVRGASQASTLGFGDEAYGKIRSLTRDASRGIEKAIYGDNMLSPISYNEAVTSQREANQVAAEANPISYIAGGFAGGALTGGAGATTAAGKQIASGLGRGNLAARSAKGMLSGATSGAVYGAGTAEEGERLRGAGEGALIGGVTGAALPVASAGINKVKIDKALNTITADDIKKLSTKSYALADQKGGILKPQFTNQFIKEINEFAPQSEVGKIFVGETPFTKTIGRAGLIKDKPITLQAAQEIDEALGDAVDSLTDAGRLTKQGKKLLDVQSHFRSMIENAGDDMIVGGREGFDALKEGRKLWSTSRKLSDVERIISRAEIMDNPTTAIKTGFRNLYYNPSRIKGYTKEERTLIKKAADSGMVSDALRTTIGSRLYPIIAGASGAGLGASALASAASIASRGAANRTQLNKAGGITREITKGILPKDFKKLPPREALKLIEDMRK